MSQPQKQHAIISAMHNWSHQEYERGLHKGVNTSRQGLPGAILDNGSHNQEQDKVR